ncbi:ATP-binding protein [Catenuloplanes indicus]|uniref:Tetratricopeptide (TPR) repeat protein/transcriptional regulator with XRE-family HTH domain n=1 Tax=Catenuloplanes indicus TaxID=137267 RepID=A0AAE3VXE9_9ACTN|nr:helix-turn-helix domain-containing protein [Catenuloplanes indicus]MDQ0364994.1 tetratricopeptide (TPR) repeat protein/transcriptional regulator with XRE-family HTH domain [Catenuloplanes indicus]
MPHDRGRAGSRSLADAADVRTVAQLAQLLRRLRRRHARDRLDSELTYRELAAASGFSVAAIAEYFTGRTLAPTDRFDVLIRLLGATAEECGALATARDRVAEARRGPRTGRGTPTPAGGATRTAVVPRQLPAAVAHFTGRSRELAELDRLADGPGPESTFVISAIGGTAGAGKTALALHWAHRVADRFPDGQLYVNLRGFDPSGMAMPVERALRGFLEALGVASSRIPAEPDAQAALYRSLVAGKRMLIILDNALDTAQVRPLLAGTPSCLVLVTSRNQLPSLVASHGAKPITVDLLPADDAVHLLTARLGAARVAAEPVALDDIVARCAGLPLALAVVAARAAGRPAQSLSRIAAELHAAGDRLDPLTTDDDPATDVRTVFSWSHDALTPAAARLFRLLGMHPGPDISVAAAASLAGVHPAHAERLVRELVRAHLITRHGPGRYVIHDLLHAFAAERARQVDDNAGRHSGAERLFDHYLHPLYRAAMLVEPNRRPVPLAAPTVGVTVEEIVDVERADAWVGTEYPVLVAGVHRAAELHFDRHAWMLAWALCDFQDRRGRWHDLTECQAVALAAARRAADLAGQAHALRYLARAQVRLGLLEAAVANLGRALDLADQVDDPLFEARCNIDLAYLLARHDPHRTGLAHAQRALELFAAAADRVWEARALNAAGWHHVLRGEYEPAVGCCERAIALLTDLDDVPGLAATWDSLGYAHQHLGRYASAIACHRRAIGLFRQLGDRFQEAETLTHLGEALRSDGSPEPARQAWTDALTILDDLNHPDAAAIRAKLAALQPAGADAASVP